MITVMDWKLCTIHDVFFCRQEAESSRSCDHLSKYMFCCYLFNAEPIAQLFLTTTGFLRNAVQMLYPLRKSYQMEQTLTYKEIRNINVNAHDSTEISRS
jgi:hypothetical protein